MAAQDEQAEVLAGVLVLVLERIEATAVVVGEIVAGGQQQLLRELMAAFAGLGGQVAGVGRLLRGLDGSVLQVQQTLSRQDAEHRFDRSQRQWVIALLLEFHEQLAEVALRLPGAWTPVDPGTADPGTAEPVRRSAAWAGRCPYQGLAPFGRAQAAVFYGRGQAIARLLSMVAVPAAGGPIIVTGASGAGKSSLLQAGLLPQLSAAAPGAPGAAYGTAGWPQISFTPGARPLQELAVQLAVRCNADPDQVLAELRADPAQAVVRRARQVLAAERIRRAPGKGAPGRADQGPLRLVVVVDQFEELFTLATTDHTGERTGRPADLGERGDGGEAEAFVAALEALAAHSGAEAQLSAGPGGGLAERGFTGQVLRSAAVVVVIAVRGDFIDRCAAYPVLARALEERAFVLGPMSEQELRRAITGPAAAAGLAVEDGLAEQIVSDLAGHLRAGGAGPGGSGGPAGSAAGALPLLSMAAARTWDEREGGRLTHAAYDRAGGVASAVTDTAEEAYTRLDGRQRQTAQRVLLALTITGADGQVSRRRVPLTELNQLTEPAGVDRSASGDRDHAAQVHRVVEAFTGARLMTTMASAGSSGRSPEPGWGSGSATGSAEPGSRTGSIPVSPPIGSLPPGEGFSAAGPPATVELAHDVLLAAWPRLRSWLAADEADRILHGRIVHDVAEWSRRGRNASFLYRGSRLEDAQNAAAHWRADPGRHPGLGLSDAAEAFLAAGARAATGTRRRWQAAASVLAGLLVVAVVTAVMAVRFGRDADQQRAGALSRSAQLVSRQAAAYSQDIPDDPATSARLAAAAWSISRTDEAAASMASLLSRPQRAVLTGHTGAVTSVAFSQDRTRLASAGVDETVRIWDAATGKQIGAPLTGHTGVVYSVAFSPDGTRLASGSDDGTVRIWDPRTGTPVGKPLTGHTHRVLSVAFSPDGTRLASGSDDGTVRIWDPRSGTLVGNPLTGHTEAVRSVAFSPAGTRLASAGNDGTVRIWDPRSGTPIGNPLTDHTGAVVSVAFSPDGTRLASGSGGDGKGGDGTVRIWDPRTGTPIGNPLTGHTDWALSVAFSPDGTRLAFAGNDGTVRIWDPRSGTPIGNSLTGHTLAVWSVAFSPDGTRLASAGDDGTVRIWDPRSGTPIGNPLTGHTDGVRSVAFSPDGTRLASGSVDKTVRIWDPRTGTPIGNPLTDTGAVWSVAFSPDGTRLASGSDGTVRIWDPRSGTPVGNPLTGHTLAVVSVAFSPDGTRLASASDDGTVRIWDPRSGTPIGNPLTGHTGAVTSVAFSPDGTRLASGSDDETVRIWDVALPRDLLGAVCAIAGRGLSPQEWRPRIPDAPYRPTCPASR
ncbi:nSTAND1 domain-containing NTPase [Sphaerisporangium corydalis]|uniref:AAA family ATPase n=1 Tax=Sphaerisporangium corydalis TaxID=1441875 RepID=A0ABV9EPC7_9ACTN|nr:AAA family ATPase [Sphaerisporangium corydalis]